MMKAGLIALLFVATQVAALPRDACVIGLLPALETVAELKNYDDVLKTWRARSTEQLWQEWEVAAIGVQMMAAAVEQLPKADREYSRDLLKAAWAAVTKHHRIYATARTFAQMDINRHREILQQLADFDSSKVRWSLYKIKRAIEARYSLQEYGDCRE